MLFLTKYGLILAILIACLLLVLTPIILLFLKLYFLRKKVKRLDTKRTIAFFHPYCNAGGGGERVLWRAVEAFQEK